MTGIRRPEDWQGGKHGNHNVYRNFYRRLDLCRNEPVGLAGTASLTTGRITWTGCWGAAAHILRL
jgi:hypothetical protein